MFSVEKEISCDNKTYPPLLCGTWGLSLVNEGAWPLYPCAQFYHQLKEKN